MTQLNIWIILILLMSNDCFAQAAFNENKLFESFFSKIRFEEIPYYTNGSTKPDMLMDQCKDTLIEIFDPETYESKFVNEKKFVQEQWKQYYNSQKYIESRDLEQKNFHLLYTNVERLKTSEIKKILSTDFPELSIDTSELIIYKFQSECDSFEQICGQKFVLNKPLINLSIQEKYNLRGIFQFGPAFLTSDKNYAITIYDVYHKWINSNGEETGMGTGGGGILIINLINKQKIEYSKWLWDY